MFKKFKALLIGSLGDCTVEVEAVNNQMALMTHEGPIIITREQAMEFYGLVDSKYKTFTDTALQYPCGLDDDELKELAEELGVNEK